MGHGLWVEHSPRDQSPETRVQTAPLGGAETYSEGSVAGGALNGTSFLNVANTQR